jgi:adenosylcobinamide-phosphate synthase
VKGLTLLGSRVVRGGNRGGRAGSAVAPAGRRDKRRSNARLDAATAAGLVCGALLDRALGDPRRMHPVAGFGSAAAILERRAYAPTVVAGVRFVVLAVAAPVTLGAWAARATRHRPLMRMVVTAAATFTVLGGTSLRREARAMATALHGGDLATARARLPALCGREPSTLDAAELARATVESVAENTCDAVVAPLCWGAIGGLPGLLGYRAVNTLDAMVGHRNARYARFGTPAARLDDVANFVPARLTAVLTTLAAPTVGGRPAATLQVWRRDGCKHPSPNAGHCEAAAAGALAVRLGGRNRYGDRVEHRPTLGDGRVPTVTDISRASTLSSSVEGAAVVLAAVLALRRWLR